MRASCPDRLRSVRPGTFPGSAASATDPLEPVHDPPRGDRRGHDPCELAPPRAAPLRRIGHGGCPASSPPAEARWVPARKQRGRLRPLRRGESSRARVGSHGRRAPAGIASALPGSGRGLRPVAPPPGAARRRAGPVGFAPGRCLRPRRHLLARRLRAGRRARSGGGSTPVLRRRCSHRPRGVPASASAEVRCIGVRRRAAAFGRRGAATSRATGATCATRGPRRSFGGVPGRAAGVFGPAVSPRDSAVASMSWDPLFPRRRCVGPDRSPARPRRGGERSVGVGPGSTSGGEPKLEGGGPARRTRRAGQGGNGNTPQPENGMGGAANP